MGTSGGRTAATGDEHSWATGHYRKDGPSGLYTREEWFRLGVTGCIETRDRGVIVAVIKIVGTMHLVKKISSQTLLFCQLLADPLTVHSWSEISIGLFFNFWLTSDWFPFSFLTTCSFCNCTYAAIFLGKPLWPTISETTIIERKGEGPEWQRGSRRSRQNDVRAVPGM